MHIFMNIFGNRSNVQTTYSIQARRCCSVRSASVVGIPYPFLYNTTRCRLRILRNMKHYLFEYPVILIITTLSLAEPTTQQTLSVSNASTGRFHDNLTSVN